MKSSCNWSVSNVRYSAFELSSPVKVGVHINDFVMLIVNRVNLWRSSLNSVEEINVSLHDWSRANIMSNLSAHQNRYIPNHVDITSGHAFDESWSSTREGHSRYLNKYILPKKNALDTTWIIPLSVWIVYPICSFLIHDVRNFKLFPDTDNYFQSYRFRQVWHQVLKMIQTISKQEFIHVPHERNHFLYLYSSQTRISTWLPTNQSDFTL